jgi:hypothetical protein
MVTMAVLLVSLLLPLQELLLVVLLYYREWY